MFEVNFHFSSSFPSSSIHFESLAHLYTTRMHQLPTSAQSSLTYVWFLLYIIFSLVSLALHHSCTSALHILHSILAPFLYNLHFYIPGTLTTTSHLVHKHWTIFCVYVYSHEATDAYIKKNPRKFNTYKKMTCYMIKSICDNNIMTWEYT